MTYEEVLAFCKDYNVEISSRYIVETDSILVRVRRGDYAIDEHISAHIATGAGFGLIIRLILRQMTATLNNMEEKK